MQPGFAGGVNLNVDACGFEPIDFFHAQKKDAPAIFDHQAIDRSAGILSLFRLDLTQQGKDPMTQFVSAARAHERQNARQAALKTFIAKWLQKIIEGADLDSLQRKAVVAVTKMVAGICAAPIASTTPK